VKAKDIQPGTRVDIDSSADYVSEDNAACVDNFYITVDSINGGWADSAAGPGEVVLYSAGQLAQPIVLPGDTELTVVVPEDPPMFQPGDRVVWTDDDEEEHGTIVSERRENDTYLVDFDTSTVKGTPAYEHELTAE
jgi:hypothetical protein